VILGGVVLILACVAIIFLMLKSRQPQPVETSATVETPTEEPREPEPEKTPKPEEEPVSAPEKPKKPKKKPKVSRITQRLKMLKEEIKVADYLDFNDLLKSARQLINEAPRTRKDIIREILSKCFVDFVKEKVVTPLINQARNLEDIQEVSEKFEEVLKKLKDFPKAVAKLKRFGAVIAQKQAKIEADLIKEATRIYEKVYKDIKDAMQKRDYKGARKIFYKLLTLPEYKSFYQAMLDIRGISPRPFYPYIDPKMYDPGVIIQTIEICTGVLTKWEYFKLAGGEKHRAMITAYPVLTYIFDLLTLAYLETALQHSLTALLELQTPDRNLSFIKPGYRHTKIVMSYDKDGFPTYIEAHHKSRLGKAVDKFTIPKISKQEYLPFKDRDLVYLLRRYYERRTRRNLSEHKLFAEYYFFSGLIYYFAGKHYHSLAGHHFLIASKLGIKEAKTFANELGAKPIVARPTDKKVDEPTKRDDRKIALKLFEEAKKMLKDKKYTRAKQLFEKLKDEFSHTDVYKKNEKKITMYLKKIERELSKGFDLSLLFEGRIEKRKKRWVKLVYDFKDEEQSDDWYLEGFAYDKGFMESDDEGYMIHKAIFENNITIEIHLTIKRFARRSGRWVGYLIHTDSSMSNYGYLCITSIDEEFGKRSFHGNPIFKMPVELEKLPDYDWEYELHEILRRMLTYGNRDIRIKEKSYKITIKRYNDQIQVKVGGARAAWAKDKEYRKGRIGICVKDTYIEVKKIIIKGTLDKMWLKEAMSN
jgi:hypothetical protein